MNCFKTRHLFDCLLPSLREGQDDHPGRTHGRKTKSNPTSREQTSLPDPWGKLRVIQKRAGSHMGPSTQKLQGSAYTPPRSDPAPSACWVTFLLHSSLSSEAGVWSRPPKPPRSLQKRQFPLRCT